MNQVLFRITASLLYMVSLSPFWLLYFLSDVLFLLMYYIPGYRKKVVRGNLKNAFPDKTHAELRSIEKKYYMFLADMILESIKSISISPAELEKRYRFENLEEITKHLDSGKSVIAVSGHYGNWEWGPLGIGLKLQQKVLVVYKPLSDSRFDKYINRVRSRFGAVMVPMKQTLRTVTQYKNEPHVLVLVGDQTPTREESQYFTSFLNQQTAVFLGVEKIAVKTNSPVIFFSINRYKRGYYCSVVKPLIDIPALTTEYQITNSHVRELESNILAQPEFWLWSHKRWKFRPEDIKRKNEGVS